MFVFGFLMELCYFLCYHENPIKEEKEACLGEQRGNFNWP